MQKHRKNSAAPARRGLGLSARTVAVRCGCGAALDRVARHYAAEQCLACHEEQRAASAARALEAGECILCGLPYRELGYRGTDGGCCGRGCQEMTDADRSAGGAR